MTMVCYYVANNSKCLMITNKIHHIFHHIPKPNTTAFEGHFHVTPSLFFSNTTTTKKRNIGLEAHLSPFIIGIQG